MPDPKKEQTLGDKIYNKLGEWDETVKKYIKSSDTYKGLKKDFKKLQASNRKKVDAYFKKKADERKNYYTRKKYKGGGKLNQHD